MTTVKYSKVNLTEEDMMLLITALKAARISYQNTISVLEESAYSGMNTTIRDNILEQSAALLIEVTKMEKLSQFLVSLEFQ